MPPRRVSRKGPDPRPVEERFWPKVNRQGTVPAHDLSLGPCWLWTGLIHAATGYGLFFMPPRTRPKVRAHRVAYELTRGSIPEGLDVLHHCDVRHCVNPSHLYLGTDADNVRDRDARHRRLPPGGAANGRARLTEDDVREIRRRAAAETQQAIANSFGVTQSQISRIVRGKQWTEVAEEAIVVAMSEKQKVAPAPPPVAPPITGAAANRASAQQRSASQRQRP